MTSHAEFPRAGKFVAGYALHDFPRAHQPLNAMRKENVKTSHLLHLSTIADFKISDQPWVKFQSAGWVNIQSAPTVNITYKILYNDAVAMTGGQPIDGTLTAAMIAHQMAAEGVRRIALVAEDLARYADRSELPACVTLHDRTELDIVQRELRELPGTTVLIYDQVCAAEKRRRRKKGELPEPKRRLFINPLVCEGCGDCGVQSNCVAILPLETEFGRKRTIDQGSCNKDYSCAKGFCPSFVTVDGGRPRKQAAREETPIAFPPEPAEVSLEHQVNILVTGIGGTGVITIGALIGMAAHLEGKGVSVLDMTGVAQKNGAVSSHVRLATRPQDIRAQRISTGEADLILGCDMLTAAAADAIAKTRPGRTRAIVNAHEQPPGQFAQNPDWRYPTAEVRALLVEAVGGRAEFVNATGIATALLGDAVGANLFMLGVAFQRGAIPLRAESLLRAIELNGVAVSMNTAAFAWGRRAAIDLDAVLRAAGIQPSPVAPIGLDDLVSRRMEFLAAYQDADYAQRYGDFVGRVRIAEQGAGLGEALATEVAQNLFKLMAYKDEYEVARLYAAPKFLQSLQEAFEGDLKLGFELAPPLLARRDSKGHLVKRRYGAWVLWLFRLLAPFKFLRGGPFDIFGYSRERCMERKLIEEYRQSIESALSKLNVRNHAIALELAAVPAMIRGFGHIKAANVELARSEQRDLLARINEITEA